MQKSNVICNRSVGRCHFSALDDRLRYFLFIFVRCKGKFSKIQREMNITRNEVKAMTNELLSVFDASPNEMYSGNNHKRSAISEHTGHRYIFDSMIR